jgi:hypothetical protein
MSEHIDKELEDQIKARLREKGIYHFGPFLKHYSREGDQPRYPIAPHYHNRWAKPHQTPHGHRPGKRSLITALRALARANPNLNIPSWISMRSKSEGEIKRIFSQHFGALDHDMINAVMGGKGAQVNWKITDFPLNRVLAVGGKKPVAGGDKDTKPKAPARAAAPSAPKAPKDAPRGNERATQDAAANTEKPKTETSRGMTESAAKKRISDLKQVFPPSVVGELLRAIAKVSAGDPGNTNRRQVLAEAMSEMSPKARKDLQSRLNKLEGSEKRSIARKLLISVLDIKLLLRLL